MPAPRVGIGVTTRNRSALLAGTLAQIRANTPEFHRLVVVDDASEDDTPAILAEATRADSNLVVVSRPARGGVAKAKNLCLKELQGCEVIFLFDDDCFPVKPGWATLFAEAIAATGVQHFNFHYPGFHKPVKEVHKGGFTVREFAAPSGVLLVISDLALRAVGAFNERYALYGFEHESYTNRCYWAGLHAGLGRNLSLADATPYIRALDFEQDKDKVKVESCMAWEERQAWIKVNRAEALRDRRRGTIYLPFENQPEPAVVAEPWWERIIPFGIRQALADRKPPS